MKRLVVFLAAVVIAAAMLGGFPVTLRADDGVPIRGHVDEVLISATPAPDGLHVTAAGEGNATHLGRFTSIENAVVHPDGTARATVILTAANGDQLFWSDVARPTSATTTAGTITFTGGTGRFENASGTAHFEFVLTPDGGTITFEGTIRF